MIYDLTIYDLTIYDLRFTIYDFTIYCGTTISLISTSLPRRSHVFSLPQWGQILPCATVG